MSTKTIAVRVPEDVNEAIESYLLQTFPAGIPRGAKQALMIQMLRIGFGTTAKQVKKENDQLQRATDKMREPVFSGGGHELDDALCVLMQNTKDAEQRAKLLEKIWKSLMGVQLDYKAEEKEAASA